MELYHWTFQDASGLCLLFGKRNSGLGSVVRKIFQEVSMNKQSIIFDINRYWQSEIIPDRTRLFFLDNKKNLIESISKLHSYISPRLNLVLVDGLPLFFRDYQGKSVIQNAINKRSFTACLAMLKNITHQNVNILVTSYTQGIHQDLPVFNDSSSYYCSKIIKIEKDNDGNVKLFSNSNNSNVYNFKP